MKILLVGHKFHGGGAEYVARVWATQLSGRGHEIVMVSTDNSDSAEWTPKGISTIRLSASLRVGHLQKVLYLRSHLKELRPDVVLSMQTYPSLVAILAVRTLLQQPKLVISERNVPSVLLKREGLSERIQLALSRKLYRLANFVVAISHPVAADLVSSFHIQPLKVQVVPNPASGKRSNTRSNSLGASGFVLVMPSRLSPQKQPLLAAEAANILKKRGHVVEVIYFGAGELEGAIVATCKDWGIPATFRGWTEAWMDDLDSRAIVVLPSFCEGFGNVLVEAACAGLPSVASSQALGVADAIIPGVTGELAYENTARGIANAVERAAALPPISADAWLDHFSPRNSTDEIERLLIRVGQQDRVV